MIKWVITIPILFLLNSCDVETHGEYRVRVESVACTCVAGSNLFHSKRSYPDGNLINSFTILKRDSLLALEKNSIDFLTDCMYGNKLSGKDVEFYWHNYDVFKVFECKNEEFKKFYRYVYQLRRRSY
jgi:hypothetical protein